jgi:hypothetical protein
MTAGFRYRISASGTGKRPERTMRIVHIRAAFFECRFIGHSFAGLDAVHLPE